MATDGISGWNELRTLRAEVSALKVQLAAARTALVIADEDFRSRSYPCDDITCGQSVCGRARRVRAALATTSAGDRRGDVSLVEFHSLVTHLRDVCDAESEGQRLVQAYAAGRAEERAGREGPKVDPRDYPCSCEELDGYTRWDPKCKNHGVE